MRDENLKWYFSTSKNAGGTGPNDAMTDLFPGGAYQNLMRESIQNSIDAKRDDSEHVRIEFTLRKFASSDFPNLLKLKDHIIKCEERTHSKKFQQMLEWIDKDEMVVLDVADYYTTGMDYDGIKDEGRFSKFVRYFGDPNSNTGAGGSHGYGKITYFNVSAIRTILVSSMFFKNNECVFEGASRLATHPTDTPKITYGDVGFFDEGEGDPIQEMPEFIDGKYIYKKIPADFQRQQVGTTVSIPFVDINDNNRGDRFKECSEAVLRSFFVALESGKLEVYISFDNGYEIEMKKSTLEEIFSTRFFTNPVDSVKKKLFERLNPHPYWLAYKNNIETTVAQGTPIEEAITLCANKQYTLIKEELPIIGNVSFYTYKNDSGNDVVIFMRRPKMMVYVTPQGKNAHRGFSSIFICNDEDGNKLLRNMENAAHNQWSYSQLERDCRSQEEINQATQIESIMQEFIKKCLDEIIFPRIDTDSEEVELEEFSVPLIDEEVSTNQFIGPLISIQGQDPEQLGAPVGLLVGQDQEVNKRVLIGQAQTIVKKKVTKTSQETSYSSGQIKKKTKKNGGKSTAGNDNYQDDESGAETYIRQKLNVKYRIISEKDSKGLDDYVLIVNSPIETERAYITINPVGETADKESGIIITHSSTGSVSGNEIKNVYLNEGKNEIHFRINEDGVFCFSLKAEHEILK